MSFSRVNKMIREIRGDRSLQSAATARSMPTNLVLGADTTGKVAVMAHTAMALGLRSLNGPIRVTYAGAAPVGLAHFPGPLLDQLQTAAESYGMGDRVEIVDSLPADGLTLRLAAPGGSGVLVDATGWVAAINVVTPETAAEVPAAVFATCAGFAKLFDAAVLKRGGQLAESWALSLETLDVTNDLPTVYSNASVSLGRVGLLGAGAIGSGVAYCLWLSNWQADLDIIDDDRYDEPNEETTFLISRAMVFQQKPAKAAGLAGRLSGHPTLTATPVEARVDSTSPFLAVRRQSFICAVDNPETRRELDHVNADVLINGAVGGTRDHAGHVVCSRHLPGGDPPLSKFYPPLEHVAIQPNLPDEVDACSRVAYERASLAAPFLGLASASLLTGAMAQVVRGSLAAAPYIKIDLFGMQQKLGRRG